MKKKIEQIRKETISSFLQVYTISFFVVAFFSNNVGGNLEEYKLLKIIITLFLAVPLMASFIQAYDFYNQRLSGIMFILAMLLGSGASYLFFLITYH